MSMLVKIEQFEFYVYKLSQGDLAWHVTKPWFSSQLRETTKTVQVVIVWNKLGFFVLFLPVAYGVRNPHFP